MTGLRVYLLAAGRGTRAGGPKAWGPYAGKTMLEAQLRFLSSVVAPEDAFVAIQAGWLERCRALSSRANWVAADPEGTPLSSLQRLLTMAPPGRSLTTYGGGTSLPYGSVVRSFILHVDMPVFDRRVWEALAASSGDAAPVHNGRRGHPVILTAVTLASVARLNPATGRLDVFLRGRPVAEVAVETDAIFANFNEAAK